MILSASRREQYPVSPMNLLRRLRFSSILQK
jgi:hypothetical protein